MAKVSPYLETKSLGLESHLSEKFVAFLDVMGFGDLVNKGSTVELENYFLNVLDILARVRRAKGEIESFLISDSIILISPSGLQGLRDLLIATRRIQAYLITHRRLLRGAISYGEVYYNSHKNIIVGKGYIRAYQLEQQASFPRVIIDPQIVGKVGQDKSDFLRLVHSRSDNDFDDRLVYSKSEYALISDDSFFVDYASKIITSEKLNSLKNVHATIMKYIYSEQKLYPKYVWLRDYFLERLKQTESVLNGKQTAKANAYRRQVSEWINRFDRL